MSRPIRNGSEAKVFSYTLLLLQMYVLSRYQGSSINLSCETWNGHQEWTLDLKYVIYT